MAAQARDAAAFFADLWELVEGWSSDAIQRTRAASDERAPDVADAEIRLLVAHAAELRGVIEAHLEEPAATPAERAAEDESGEPDSAPVPNRAEVPEHACNSADFDRPPCEECQGRHWYCSICGARRDDCPAA